jgi:hypothetical protein
MNINIVIPIPPTITIYLSKPLGVGSGGSSFTYNRPGGVDSYFRPDGTSTYLRP